MIEPGVYPASVTPYDAAGEIDWVSLTKLLSWFKVSGCKGVVVAGTNGEGNYLSAVEKRDLARKAVELGDGLAVILGLGTQSLSEAKWLCSQGAKAGCKACLVMAPGFNSPNLDGVYEWYVKVADDSALPVIVYHHPSITRVDLGTDRILRLTEHPNVCGFKWSSGNFEEEVKWKASIATDKVALMGDETLLFKALQAGWTGTISGASNVLAPWIVKLCSEPSAELDEFLQPLLQAIRKSPQPATHKSILAGRGVLACDEPRLPLLAACGGEVEEAIRAKLGQL